MKDFGMTTMARLLAAVAVPAALAAGAAAAQEPAVEERGVMGEAHVGAGEMTCRDLTAMAPQDMERMVYFLSGFAAGQRGDADAEADAEAGMPEPEVDGGDELEIEGEDEAVFDPATDPRLGQMQPVSPTMFEISMDRIMAACQEDPERLAVEVVEEQRMAGAADHHDDADQPDSNDEYEDADGEEEANESQ